MTACPHCGAQLHPLADLARLALQISTRSGQGLHALENRRIAVPSVVPVALQEAHLDGRILAARLACHAGTCAAPESASSPTTASAPTQGADTQAPPTSRRQDRP